MIVADLVHLHITTIICVVGSIDIFICQSGVWGRAYAEGCHGQSAPGQDYADWSVAEQPTETQCYGQLL